jgi:capsid portal protein
METADGRRQTAGEQAFQPVERQTVTNGGTNKRMETADGGRQTAGEQAFQPVERQTVNEWGNE